MLSGSVRSCGTAWVAGADRWVVDAHPDAPSPSTITAADAQNLID
jgi:hypothetical protein